MPSGSYQIRVYAIDAATNQTFAVDCIDHEVHNFTEVKLLSPLNNSIFSNTYFEIQDENEKSKPTKGDQIPILKSNDKQFGNLYKRLHVLKSLPCLTAAYYIAVVF